METAPSFIDYYAQACGNEATERALLERRYHFDPRPPRPGSAYDTRLLARVGFDGEAARAVHHFTWRYHRECGKQVAGHHLVEVTNEAMVQAWELAGKPAAAPTPEPGARDGPAARPQTLISHF